MENNIKINDASFLDISSENNGSALLFADEKNLNLKCSSFYYCRSKEYGGCIYALGLHTFHAQNIIGCNNSAKYGFCFYCEVSINCLKKQEVILVEQYDI